MTKIGFKTQKEPHITLLLITITLLLLLQLIILLSLI